MNSNSETDTELARRFAMQTVEDRLRQLAANILRSIRGAGKPHEILPQAQALIEADQSYRQQVGAPPASDEFGKILDIDTPNEKLDQMSPESEAIVTARERVIRGSLQIAASRLLEQRTHESAGDAELQDSISDYEVARKERQKKMIAQQQPLQSPPPSKSRRRP